MKKIFFFLIALELSSCTKDRELMPGSVGPLPAEYTQGAPGIIMLNEFVSGGSLNLNEFGDAEDWMELYNTGSKAVKLEPGKWFVTDDNIASRHKYALPGLTLQPYSYVVVWCDDLDTVNNDIHANFKLSSSGDKLGIFYDNDGTDIIIDTYDYTMQQDAKSEGRSPDGSPSWITFDLPTPGESNQ